MGAGAVLTCGRLAPSEPAGPESSRGANFLPVRPRPVPQLWLPHSCHLLGSGQCVCAAAVRPARARLGSQTRVSLPVWPCSPCVRPGGGVTGGPGAGGRRAPLCCVLPVEPALLSSRWSSWFLHTWAQPPMFPGGTAGPPSRPRGRGLGDGPGGCRRQVGGRRGVAPCVSAASFRGAGTSLTHPAGRNVLTHFLPGDVLSVNGAFADGGFHMTQRSPANLM